MKIASSLFEAFLKCPTKCYLRSVGETGSGNEYAAWVRAQDESYERDEVQRLQDSVPETERVVAPLATEKLKAAQWRLAENFVAQAPYRSADGHVRASKPGDIEAGGQGFPRSECVLESRLHAVERIPSEGRGRPAQFLPIRCIFRNKLTKDDKLLLAFDAFVLSQAVGREVSLGKIIHGDVRSRPGESTAEKSTSGSTGYQPVPSGNLPDGTARTSATEPDAGFASNPSPIPVGESPTGTGESPVPPLTKGGVGSAADCQPEAEAAKTGEIPAALLGAQLQPQVLRVKTSALVGEVRKRIEKISALLSSPTPPDLVLNRHCPECEYRDRCRKIAIEKDDLSLLAGMSAKERQKLRSKGIFTVTQLSYTFRARRRPKRLRERQEKYHHSLKALAIREKKIHIVGSPELKIEGTPVYLDVEGLPDRDFYYLIGLRIGNGDSAVRHSLWADTVEDEGKIWREFLAILDTVEKPVLIHYGRYETTFLRRMSERHGNPAERSVAATGIASPVNLLSVIFAQIYFPVSSNGLKDTAGFLGFTWANADFSGLNSVAWRHRWEELLDGTTKVKLLTYNAQDCEALSLMTDRVGQLVGQLVAESSTQSGGAHVVHADAEQFHAKSKWRAFISPVNGFEKINAAAHWDYQRHRVYARSATAAKRAAPPHPRSLRPEQAQLVIVWPASHGCPKCQRKVRSKATKKSTTVHDIVFGRHSLKRRVVKHVFRTYHCRQCRVDFGMEERFRLFRQYGWNLVAYLFFQLVELNIPQLTVVRHFNRLFRFDRSTSTLNNMKTRVTGYYGETKQRILEHIIRGRLVHADETRANSKGKTGFV